VRARWLKPEFFTDKKMAALGPPAALVFQALWCMADDGGTAPCDADTVKAQMFYRWSAVGVPEITEALRHLSAAGRIVRYQVGDDTFCTIPTWGEHQQVHKPSKFRNPHISQGVALEVPEQCGTGEAPLPASPPPRHLDSQTPRHLTTPPAAVEKKAPPAVLRSSAEVEAILAHYRAAHPRKRPDDKARKAIAGALSRGYTVAEVCEAIDGNARDDWAKRTGNQGLPYLLRDNATTDKYRALGSAEVPALFDYETGELTPYGERVTRPDAVSA
jgi:hypothetical protein